ncbi:ABC1 kinase family protein [Catenovulum maritimum]|uniref:Ubiquinol-cytochrome C reductase n=1 Tax=Catenovulum maritimum TaxID=1513271 RepID=A0A0J8JI21_9ALTE|nr:AarF/ABC1/UbiB kinase family protein [Catenovulum maritimum]KMT64086.1 ubiquinol-cytochrome C reductase [Catenovulum maritimum]
MSDYKSSKVPTSRLARLSKIGGLATSIAGNMLTSSIKDLSKGEKPNLQKLMLTPKNIESIASKLSQMRGAAMKVGQLLSMDTGDLLPEELSDLLAKLRADATPMPHKQLVSVLKGNWGEHWIDSFSHFDLKPFAAASIGQVHLAYSERGEKLAVKVQYPGIQQTIDSDVDNVASLIKLTRLLPDHIEIDELLTQAKQQLHTEANYIQEASYLAQYQTALGNNDDFILPVSYPELNTENILCMQFVEGESIENCVYLAQDERNKIIASLFKLFAQELFRFKLMQSDPNFANFMYNQADNKIVLIDFGATREIPEHVSQGYFQFMLSAIEQNETNMMQAAEKIGFFRSDISDSHKKDITKIFYLATKPLRYDGEFDFANSDFTNEVKEASHVIGADKDQWHTPPIDAIFIHRKLGGLYLLAAKLKAKVNLNQIFSQILMQSR